MATRKRINPAEQQEMERLAAEMQNNFGVSFVREGQDSAKNTPTPTKNESSTKTEKSISVGIQNFQERVFGSKEEFENLRKEMFARTVALTYAKIKKESRNNIEFDNFIDGESKEAKLLRQISRIRKSENYNEITSEINALTDILEDKNEFPITQGKIIKIDEKGNSTKEQGIIDISQKLKGALDRVRKLDEIRVRIEQAPVLDQQIKGRTEILLRTKADAFDAHNNYEAKRKAADEAKKRLDKLKTDVDSSQLVLSELEKAKQSVPIPRKIRREQTNDSKQVKEQVGNLAMPTVQIKVEPIIPVETEVELQKRAEIRRAQELEFEKLKKEEKLKNEKIESLILVVENKINGYDEALLANFQGEISKANQKTNSKLTPKTFQLLTGESHFEDIPTKNIIHGRISNIIQGKLIKCKNGTNAEAVEPELEIIKYIEQLPTFFKITEQDIANFYKDEIVRSSNREWILNLLTILNNTIKAEGDITKGYKTFVHQYKNQMLEGITFKESKQVKFIAIPNLGISDEHIRFRLNNKGRFTISLIQVGNKLELKLIIGDDHDDL